MEKNIGILDSSLINLGSSSTSAGVDAITLHIDTTKNIDERLSAFMLLLKSKIKSSLIPAKYSSYNNIAKRLGISKATCFKYINLCLAEGLITKDKTTGNLFALPLYNSIHTANPKSKKGYILDFNPNLLKIVVAKKDNIYLLVKKIRVEKMKLYVKKAQHRIACKHSITEEKIKCSLKTMSKTFKLSIQRSSELKKELFSKHGILFRRDRKQLCKMSAKEFYSFQMDFIENKGQGMVYRNRQGFVWKELTSIVDYDKYYNFRIMLRPGER